MPHRTIKLTDIIIKSNRQRQHFDPTAIQELKDSIEYLEGAKNNQLMHPPVLRREGQDYVLVAGERRCKAIEEIFALGGSFVCDGALYTADRGMIPFTDLGDLSELEAEEAELDENLKRQDLTWQEHAAAVAKLHSLRVRQKEAERAEELQDLVESADNLEASLGALLESPATPAHTIADTAKEVYGRSDGWYQDSVRKEVLISRHLDNPDIAKAKSADEAFKILKKQETAKKNLELAKVVGTNFTADKHEIHNMSCLVFMTSYADQVARGDAKGIDVILTDPPYGMEAHSFGDGGGKMLGIVHQYDDSHESWLALMEQWSKLSFKVTAEQAHAYVFCDFDRFHELKTFMEKAGWYVFRTPMIAHKINSGRVPLPDRGPRRQYELVLYAIKGAKPVTHIYGDVISTQADDNMTHGAQKPVALYENLLQRSVKPGDLVADFFAGTGTILPAAHGFKCTAIAVEQNPEYYGMCVKRVQALKQADSQIVMEV